jgi:hypothetical protein
MILITIVAPDIATKIIEEDLSLEDGLEQHQQNEDYGAQQAM